MRLALVNPALAVLRRDPFTTGIPYMPVSLAYAAAALRAAAHQVEVVDAFGERPGQYRLDGRFLIRGLTPRQVHERVPLEVEAIVLYAGNLTCHRSLEEILRGLRRWRPSAPVIVMENTQAVTAYSLRRVRAELFDAGATYVLCGEPEERLVALVSRISTRRPPEGMDGVGWRDDRGEHFEEPSAANSDLDRVPFPAWELFPLEGYWSLRYAHGAMERARYLPLLTSRGCPYPCKFCVIPETNGMRWRSRSAGNVVDEMEHWRRTLGVTEFHIEDVNPTIDDARTKAICREIIDRRLAVVWKLSAGTKVESIKSEETIDLMAEAGCRYISISPESGSPEVMRRIGKPFDIEHAIRLVGRMHERGIRCQCCFVLGFPGETDRDRRMTWDMVRRLTKRGADEVALFIVTPVPGSKIFDQFSGFEEYAQLNFSPAWREDFPSLNRFRLRLYAAFLGWKLRYHPAKLLAQPFHFLSRRFRTKMEMTPYRVLHTTLMSLGILGPPVSTASDEGPTEAGRIGDGEASPSVPTPHGVRSAAWGTES